MKRDIKLYNLIFPMWGIYFYAILFPYFFVLLLPANFIVDTVMLLLLFFLFKVPEKKELYRKGLVERDMEGEGVSDTAECGFGAFSLTG